MTRPGDGEATDPRGLSPLGPLLEAIGVPLHDFDPIARIRAAYDRVAPEYDQVADCTDTAQAEDAWLLAHFLDRFRSPVLDLGCGTGQLLDLFELDPGNYLGIDLSAGMLAEARVKHPEHRFLVGDMLEWADMPLLVPATTFVGFGVFHHAPDPGDFVNALARGLRPSHGLIYAILTTPAHAEQACACHWYEAGLDIRSYTPDDAWALFGPRFDEVHIDPLPSPGHPGSYFVVTGRA